MAKPVKFKPAPNPWQSAGMTRIVKGMSKKRGGSGRKGTNGGKPGGS